MVNLNSRVNKALAAANDLLEQRQAAAQALADDPRERLKAAVIAAVELLDHLGWPDDPLVRVIDVIEAELKRGGVWCGLAWPTGLAGLLALTPPEWRDRVIDAARRRDHSTLDHPLRHW